MQYLWKLTVLGLEQQVNRLVSLDGELPLDSVLNLCNLAFDFDNYPEKSLYFAQGQSGREFMAKLLPALADSYGAQSVEFWRPEHCLQYLDLEQACEQGKLLKLDLKQQPSLKLKFATAVLTEYLAAYKQELEQASADSMDSDAVHPVFIYQLHGVNLLVEVMKVTPKLMCFVPATLAGRGLVADDQQNLSLSALQSQLQQQEQQEEQTGEGTVLDLRTCTARMRALQTNIDSDEINQVLIQSGAVPLKAVVSDQRETGH